MPLLLAQQVADPTAYQREYQQGIEAWRQERGDRLTADGGWLTVVGLFWLKPGPNHFGADLSNEIVLPAHSSPGRAGTFVMEGGRVTVDVAAGIPVVMGGKRVTRTALRSDAGGIEPDVLTLGALTMQVIDREGRLAIRLKDMRSPARKAFKGLRYFPVNLEYRVTGRFTPHPAPVMLSVPVVTGGRRSMSSPGYVEFEIAGKTLRLDPVIEPGEKRLFFIFRDQTSGRKTYGGGRFLYADPPKDGRVVLDFNRAFTPPCAFTAFATCPLALEQNRLRVPIEAGEMQGGH
jgi:uncharacterized protein (DUF1684 family)